MFAALLVTAAPFPAAADRSAKAGMKTPHPADPEPVRASKSALTEEVSQLLPPHKRIEAKRRNYIDDFVFRKMQQHGIGDAGLASDQEFLRRISLDLTGRIPTAAEVRKFLSDESPDKRDKLIDSIIKPERYAFAEDDPFVDRWTYWFSDLFGNNGGQLGTQGRNLFYDYIRMCLRINVPYSRMVTEMLTATALTNWYSGPSNFLARFHVDDSSGNQIAHEDSCDEMAIGSARVFLGLNLECISCHNGAGHLEKINAWLSKRKRDELWKEAAFFGDLTIYRPPPRRQEFTMVEHGQGYDAEAYPVPGATGYDVKAESVVRMKRWKADVTPTFMLTGERVSANEDPRRALARMIVSSPQFARATVNWIWAELMGVGIVDPPYDFDLARQDPNNPPPAPWSVQPTHPELLDALAKDFQAHNYDLRYLIELITKSATYQMSSYYDGQWKDDYARYYARHFVRRLGAEELFDAIAASTGVLPSIPIGGTNIKVHYVMQTRSSEDLGGDLADIGRFLGSFGQSNRDRAMKTLQGTAVQASLLLNSKVVKERIKAEPGTLLRSLLDRDPPLSNADIVDELFLSTVSRYPSSMEKQLAVDRIRDYRTQGAEDLLWALLNKLDFEFNY